MGARLRRSSTSRRSAGGRGSLTIVGTGISLVGQTTLEAVRCMTRAEKLLYLAGNAVAGAWIQTLNATAESLADCYGSGLPRIDSYRMMVERILAAVRSGANVCVAFYGHPGIFVNPSHRAIRLARREGFPARMLPGVSSEDCLFADLGIDPADTGCQSFEATAFLETHRRFDPSSMLLLWQIAAIRQVSIDATPATRQRGLRALGAALRRYYPSGHKVVVYEASQLPVCEPTIIRVPLSELGRVTVTPMATLYVPPLRSRKTSGRMKRRQ